MAQGRSLNQFDSVTPTSANSIRLEYRANNAVMTEFRVTSLLVWKL